MADIKEKDQDKQEEILKELKSLQNKLDYLLLMQGVPKSKIKELEKQAK